MRGLPYFVSNTTSTAKVDVLDRYYPDHDPGGAPTAQQTLPPGATNKDRVERLRAGRRRLADAVRADGGVLPDHRSTRAGASGRPRIVVATQFVGPGGRRRPSAPSVEPSPDTPGTRRPGLLLPRADRRLRHGRLRPGRRRRYTDYTRTDIADRRGGPPLVSCRDQRGRRHRRRDACDRCGSTPGDRHRRRQR